MEKLMNVLLCMVLIVFFLFFMLYVISETLRLLGV